MEVELIKKSYLLMDLTRLAQQQRDLEYLKDLQRLELSFHTEEINIKRYSEYLLIFFRLLMEISKRHTTQNKIYRALGVIKREVDLIKKL